MELLSPMYKGMYKGNDITDLVIAEELGMESYNKPLIKVFKV